ncbi:PR-1-like protein [Cutaneotrichosporon oleaginosum]|uniref:PR-1-like protein n=1 Tax=Cutaneotrichosporon oleaginosum TaxID=879819 RepID=A0A0J0XMW5_9TREE|nr:PR-1-like protein [Cutaneotrichosporon oleaginosum]KLT42446.1 PR-1-like protein [Cutaneotrichosporon oleaginosum]TXT06965.1 hypothetical protein COLE_06296 [Cutaneotrichosporon oleaginosum]
MRAAAILPVLALLATADARKCKAKHSTASPVPSVTPVADDNALIHQPEPTPSSSESASSEATPTESSSVVTSETPAPSPTSEESASASASPSPSPSPSAEPQGPANPDGAVPASDPLAEQILQAHNEIRARYGVPAVSWNEELSAIAVGQAQTCNQVPQFPASRQDYTDSLVPSHDGDFVRSVHDAGWEGENYVYPTDGGDKTYQEAAARWTQVVWRATTDIGCGWHKCEEWPEAAQLNGQYKFVCVYNTHQTYVGSPEAFNANIPDKLE